MSHAALSPSARHRWSVCPASVRMEAQYPEESSDAADDGTHTHTLIESCLATYPQVTSPETYIGMVMGDHAGQFKVDEERAKRAKVCVDYVLSRCAAYFTEDGQPPAVITERRVDPWPVVYRFDMSGTVDIQIHAKDEVEVIDYKDGYKPVSVIGNKQLRQYAVAVLAEQQGRFQRVRTTIIQPKASPLASSVVLPVEGFLAQEVPALVREATACDEGSLFVPGEEQCRYCRHRNACKARADAAGEALSVLFAPQAPTAPLDAQTPPAPALSVTTQVAEKDPTTMDNDQLRQLLEAAPLIRQVLEGAEAEVQKRLEAGQSVPGFKLVHGRGSRQWALPEEQIEKALTGMGVPKAEVWTSKLVSPAQAEKLTWTKKDGTKVTLTDKQLARLTKEYITSMAGKLTVAPEADPRPSAKIDATPLFKPVEQEKAQEIPEWMK